MTSPSAWESLAYGELRQLAASLMEVERRAHTLQPTALVHEAWLRLCNRPEVAELPPAEFFKLAATVMRRILTDHARRAAAGKRGGGRRRVSFTEPAADRPADEYVGLLDDALQRLAGTDAELARLVELRFFAGCTTEELALVLHLSPRTVKRRWRFARAWLHRAITEQEP